MAKVDGMMKNLKTENLSLHGDIVAERAAHARVSMKNIRFLRNKNKTVEGKEKVARLLAAERSTRENSATIEWLMKDVSSVTNKAAEKIGALTTLLEQVVKKVGEFKKERKAATRKLSELGKGNERVQYERHGQQARLQLAKRQQEICAAAFNRLKSNVGQPQECVVKDSSASQHRLEDH